VLNGRNISLRLENEELRAKLDAYSVGAIRIPNWLIIANALLIVLLLLNLILLSAFH
jgi:hypothetical protein